MNQDTSNNLPIILHASLATPYLTEDAVFFQQHPEHHWYAREMTVEEMQVEYDLCFGEFSDAPELPLDQYLFGSIQRQNIDPNKLLRMMQVVFQIIPGTRVRVPCFEVNEDGKVAYFGILSEVRVEPDKIIKQLETKRNGCVDCGMEAFLGRVQFYFTFDITRIRCAWCAVSLIRKGRQLKQLGVYTGSTFPVLIPHLKEANQMVNKILRLKKDTSTLLAFMAPILARHVNNPHPLFGQKVIKG